MARAQPSFAFAAPGPGDDPDTRSMRWLWPALLVAATAAASLAFACDAPFAALTLVAARTLGLRSAFLTVTAVWLANQAVGFGMLGYPHDVETLAWGIAIGLAALASLAAAAALMRRLDAAASALSVLAGFATSFAVFEAVLLAAALVLGGTENFAPAIVGQVLLLNGAWAVALIAVHEAWRWARHSRSLTLPGILLPR